MKRIFMIGACALGVLSAAGCGSGGGGTSGSGGALAMTLRWPARVAAPLPSNTQAIRVTLYRYGNGNGTSEGGEQVIAGPKLVSKPDNRDPGPARVVFEDLPPGPVRAEVKAYGTREGTDEPCASGSNSGTIELGKQTRILIDMFSHTYRVEVSPPSIQLAVNGRQTLAAKAYDFNNNVLLGIGFHWFSQDPTIAAVDPVTGEVTGLTAGTTLISAQEEFKTFTGSATVTVQ